MHKIQFLVAAVGLMLFSLSCSSAAKKTDAPSPVKEVAPAKETAPVAAPSKSASKSPAGKVWVSKSDGSKSCGFAQGVTPKAAAKELQKKGLKIHKFRKGSDGLMHTQECGGSTGHTVEILINFQDLAKAQEQGFEPMLPQPN